MCQQFPGDRDIKFLCCATALDNNSRHAKSITGVEPSLVTT
jgi:hypothetical protein